MEKPLPPSATAVPTALRRDEWLRVVLACAAFFLLLCSYTMLRPVRDDMAVRFGADRLHWLFTGTFLCTLLVVPAFGWAVRHLPRTRILPAAYGFLVLNLLMFCAAFAREGNAVTAAAFFIWLSVFNLFVVSLFWSNVSDAFSTEESHRLYGYVAAGGTVGALAGPTVTALAARHLGTASLLALSALLLALASICMVALRRHIPPGMHGAREASRPVGGSILAGIGLTLQSARLRSIALLIVCLTTVSTVLYVELIDATAKAMPHSGERKAFFASVDLAVNILALALQLLGTGRIVKYGGLGIALALSPLVVLAGFGALNVWGTATGLAAVQVLHRAGEFALNKPGREMIYTTVDPESRFKAKNFIDTAVYRANDAASAWLVNAIRAAGLNAVWLVGMPAALVWLVTGFRIGSRHVHERSDGSDRKGDAHEPA
jgi:ATP:ADP antiporter, AAA family